MRSTVDTSIDTRRLFVGDENMTVSVGRREIVMADTAELFEIGSRIEKRRDILHRRSRTDPYRTTCASVVQLIKAMQISR